jgi:hypothetical protein
VKWDNIAIKKFKVLLDEEIYMQSGQDKKKTKQSYEKPRLRTIELAAEEVLAVGCKLDTGPLAAPTDAPCTANGCSAAGS